MESDNWQSDNWQSDNWPWQATNKLMLSFQYDWPLATDTGPLATDTDKAWLGSRPSNVAFVWRVDISGGKHPTDRHWGLLSNTEQSRAHRFAHDKDRTQFVLAHAALRQIVGSYHNIRPKSVQFALGKYGKPHLANHDWTQHEQQKATHRPRSLECNPAPDRSGSSNPPRPRATLNDPLARPPLEFSLTHSGQWALVALAERSIGVDIERVRPVDSLDAMISRICTPREERHLHQMACQEQLEEFFRLWTAKEAVLKGAGLGLQIEPSLVEIPASADGLWKPISLAHGGQPSAWHLHRFAVDQHHTAAIAISESVATLRMGTWMG